MSCVNRNYLASEDIYTWTLNTSSENSYKVMYLNETIDESTASNQRRINPVIYLSSKVITNDGDGSLEKPYVIK